MQRLVAFDREASLCLAVPQEARLLRLMALVVAHSGDSPLWLFIAAATLARGGAFGRALGARVLVGTLVAGVVVTILKWTFQRERPPGEGWGFYSRFDRHAFPSGHAGRSACLCILLWPILPSWGGALIVLWAGGVGLARVALRVHFLSDIVGGWMAGILVGMALQWAL